ncbi:putative death-receptor fusion protein-domain-containing protein [Kockovaella imperatae]|uniref:Putative death-receptor fusion protein-domain-containing protein n=1 Tax=Kockovaella imperatae TaxID=4999 RepID=A0A1Y1UJY6_9TREE|nr:putative death-receptor fusion protein-domain-containing protein [Kockovaella imperatae]ORX37814.1 putative death-receptor fusion protein-domain-containing protein [Kockovaella imperatae]
MGAEAVRVIEQATSKKLQDLRKRVQKAPPEELGSPSLLGEALDFATQRYPEDEILEVLAFLLVLFRRLKAALPVLPQAGHDLVHVKLGPAVLPGGTLAHLLLDGMETSQKPRHIRSVDTFGALARMTEDLEAPSTGGSSYNGLLTPLFVHLCGTELSTKHSLIAINTLLPFVPRSIDRSQLLVKIRSQMDLVEGASGRGAIFSKLLVEMFAATAGDDKRKETIVVDEIVPMFKMNTPPTTLTHAVRYFLPSLFTALPSIPLRILSEVEPAHPSANPSERSDATQVGEHGHERSNLSAWIAIASLCVATNQVSLLDLPSEVLDSAMVHADPTVQIDTLRLLLSSKDRLKTPVMGLYQRSISACAILQDAYARSEFTATIVQLFKSFETVRRLKRPAEEDLSAIRGFITWLLEVIIDPGLESALRFPIVRTIIALNILGALTVELGSDNKLHEQIFTRRRVDSLLACQKSNFAEVRSKARSLLACAQIPLPGYESPDHLGMKTTLESAILNISHPRKTQVEAGKAVMCILFEMMTKRASLEYCVDFVRSLIKLLEKRVEAAEEDVATGIIEKPLHGIISALSGVIACVQLQSDHEADWKEVFHEIIPLVDRIWAVARVVVSLKSSGTSERPDHEIARVYEVLKAGGEEDNDPSDFSSLLSGCWRAITEAGDLLATVCSLPLTQGGEKQIIWSRDDIESAGKRLLSWLHEVRHRGTFSKIASSLARLVDSVYRIASLRPLVYSWLDLELETITSSTFSTTRRSAALPYSILSIVVADYDLLKIAVDRLLAVAAVRNDASDDATKIHAFNILKIILLDSRTSQYLDRSFERAILVALAAFESVNWNVRNVGLILFSSLIHRSLLTSDSAQDYFQSRQTLAKRQTLASWHARYPSVLPALRVELRKAALRVDLAGHSSLFPILIIIRSLRWSAVDEEISEALRLEVLPFLCSKEWQIRQVAAQALSSLQSPLSTLDSLAICSKTFAALKSNNARHGHILYWIRLISDVIDFETLDDDMRVTIDQQIEAILNGLDHRLTPPSVMAASIQLAKAFSHACTQTSMEGKVVALCHDILRHTSSLPGADTLLNEAAKAVIAGGQRTEVLLKSRIPQHAIMICLEKLEVDPVDKQREAIVFNKLADIVLSRASPPTVLEAALGALVRLNLPENGIGCERLNAISKRLRGIMLEGHNVPLREASLIALGWVSKTMLRRDSGHLSDSQCLSEMILAADKFSRIDKSKPSRTSAALAIQHLHRHLFPSSSSQSHVSSSILLTFHRVLVRLLQDDDYEIRSMTQGIICNGLNLTTPVCLTRAISVEWAWIAEVVAGDPEVFLPFIWDHSIDIEGFRHDLSMIQADSYQTNVLFEVESPNQFRDPLIDSDHATRVLVDISVREPSLLSDKITQSNTAVLLSLHVEAKKALGELEAEGGGSPIGEAFEAGRMLRRRLQIHSGLVKRLAA